MDAILLLVTEFTEELIWAQMCLISIWSAIYLYQYVVKRREAINPELVPSSVVKDYLNRVRDGEAAIRFQLFGEAPTASGAPIVMQAGTDPGLMRELEALRAQLGTADQRVQEKEKIIAELRAKGSAGGTGGNPAELEAAKAAWAKERAELEKKLASALSAGTSSGVSPELQKEIDEMKARLQEYEVIEDDLANLKKYQIENKRLQEQLTAAGLTPNAGGGGDAKTAAAPAAPAAAKPADAPKIEAKAVDAPAADAAVAVAAAAAPAPAASAEPVAAPAEAAPVAAAPEAAPAAAATGEKKPGDEDLLSEFEKMLAS